jgi:ubiquinone biosynthesis protein COQ9
LALRKYTHVRCITFGAPHTIKQDNAHTSKLQHHPSLDVCVFRYEFEDDLVPTALDAVGFTSSGSVVVLPNRPSYSPSPRMKMREIGNTLSEDEDGIVHESSKTLNKASAVTDDGLDKVQSSRACMYFVCV